MKTPSKIAIIVLNWNGKQDTLACLSSLSQLTYPHREVIVVDNGSTDDSVAAIQAQFPLLALIETGINLGFAEGNNRGIELALRNGADLILLLNNDTIVAPDLLERFLETAQTHPQAGIFGAKILLFDQRETLDHLGGKWNQKRGEFTFIGHRQPGSNFSSPETLDYVCGAAFLIRKEVIEKIGMLEPRFFLIWEESDFCFRARRMGFLTITCPQALVWHKVSASFVGGKPHSTYFFWRNRFLFIERNLCRKEKLSLFFRLFLPETLHLLKISLLKRLQLRLLQTFYPKADLAEKRKRLLTTQAALAGIRDYSLRRFGNGPSWIYNSGQTQSKLL